MIVFDKSEIRQALGLENIYDLLIEWGGDPEYTEFGILSSTICHNPPGEGSRKLYFYENTGLFKCYTGCDSTFDIFELCSKVMKIQYDEEFDLNDSVLWVARRFGLSGMIKDDDMGKTLDDWKILSNYSRIQEIELKNNKIILKDYDDSILNRLNYNIKIVPWLDEGISQEVIDQVKSLSAQKGYTIDFGMYDGHTLPFEADSFDVIIIWAQTFGLLYGNEYKNEFLQECKRILSSDGLLSYSGHDYKFVMDNYKQCLKERKFYPYADTELYWETFQLEELASFAQNNGYTVLLCEKGEIYVPEDGTILHCLCRKKSM